MLSPGATPAGLRWVHHGWVDPQPTPEQKREQALAADRVRREQAHEVKAVIIERLKRAEGDGPSG